MPWANFDVSLDDGIAIVRMNRPPANAFDRDMYIEAKELFSNPDSIGKDLKVIVLTGQGRHFSGGNDLDEFETMTPENGTERMWRVREAFFAIQDCPVPVIAAVNGAAIGTGLAVAASCDFIVAAKDARFGLAELKVGVFGGARHLARIAPQALTRRMFLTAEVLRADAFVQAGGSAIVCESDALLETALSYARTIAALSAPAVRVGKRVLNRIENMDIRTGYELEQGFTVKMSANADSKEALAAFREGRNPVYTDRLTGDFI